MLLGFVCIGLPCQCFTWHIYSYFVYYCLLSYMGFLGWCFLFFLFINGFVFFLVKYWVISYTRMFLVVIGFYWGGCLAHLCLNKFKHLEHMNTIQKQQVIDLLQSKITEFSPADYLSVNDDFRTFDDIADLLDGNGAFNIDIIYYANAIKYLAANDPSLRDSLELASELGYTAENLNSEVLASLLASQNARNEFYELQSDIEDLINLFEDETQDEE